MGIGHYAGEVEDIITGILTVVSSIAMPKIRSFFAVWWRYAKK